MRIKSGKILGRKKFCSVFQSDFKREYLFNNIWPILFHYLLPSLRQFPVFILRELGNILNEELV